MAKVKKTLFDTNPELRNEWNEEKNGSMSNYTQGSRKKMRVILYITIVTI